MSIVFKTIPQDDQTVTPFKVYKSWEYTGTSATRFKDLYSSSIFLGTAIKPDPSNYTGQLMSLDFDRESDTNDASRLLNTHLQNTPAGLLWYSLKHKYFNDYNDFISFAGNAEPLNLNTNSTEWEGLTFTATSASLNKSYNFIDDKLSPSSSYGLPSIASVISIPQIKFGEEIKPGSFEIIFTSSIYTGPLGYKYSIIDDSNGNLILGSSVGAPGYGIDNRIFRLSFDDSEFEQISKNNRPDPRYPTNIEFYNVSIVTSSAKYPFTTSPASPTTYYAPLGLSAQLSSSYIRIDGTPSYFNPRIEDDYTISFWFSLKTLPSSGKKAYLVTKRGLKRDYGLIGRDGRRSAGNVWNLNENIFPYNIYVDDTGAIIAEVSDGTTLVRLSSANSGNTISTNTAYYCAFQKNGNVYTLYTNISGNSITYDDQITQDLINITNKSDIFIGSLATKDNDLTSANSFMYGDIDEFCIFNTGDDYIPTYAGSYVNAYIHEYSVGKIFYKEGIAVINSSNPLFGSKYIFNESGYLTTLPFSSTLYNNSPNIINHNGMWPTTSTPSFSNINATGSWDNITVKWNSTVTIYENEILCRIREDEFNVTLNPTILKSQENSYIPQDYVYDDEFTPYITTIGLYNDKAELLAVGKLANPIKKRPDVDLNIIIRFDQ